jgi:hypothetical protein
MRTSMRFAETDREGKGTQTLIWCGVPRKAYLAVYRGHAARGLKCSDCPLGNKAGRWGGYCEKSALKQALCAWPAALLFAGMV